MKKFIKIFLLSLTSLIGIILIAVCVVIFLVFTPERFTPVVRKQLDNLVTCQSDVGRVELTFFSTFPEFGVRIKHFALINPVEDSRYDTLVCADELVGTVDAAAWWQKNKLIVTGLQLKGGTVNIFTDSLGRSNYNVVPTDSVPPEEAESGSAMPEIEVRNVVLDNINMNYRDLASKLTAAIKDLSAKISGTVSKDKISGEIKVKRSLISLEYDKEEYLQQASVYFDIPMELVSGQTIRLKNASFTLNDLGILLDGSIGNDTVNKEIVTDLSYRIDSWQIEKLLELVPPSFKQYLNGIDAEGLVSSEGIIRGPFSDSSMPLLDIHLLVDRGSMRYSGLPLPFHDVKADISILTDLKTDSLSFVKINRFSARTPSSSVTTSGLIDHLLSDIFCNLSTSAALNLDELNHLIPDSLRIKLKGRAGGSIRSAFSLSQLEKMQLGKMRLNGSLILTNLDALYDSISLRTDHSMVDFSLPSIRPSSKNTRFAFASVSGDRIDLEKIQSYRASVLNASLTLESSDARDTTRIPDVICEFAVDSISAQIDTMSIAVAGPRGKVTLAPVTRRPGEPRITLLFDSRQLRAVMGQNTVSASKISIDTDITNDKKQKEIFLQWLARGFVDLDNGELNIAGLSHPVEVPALKMRFDPETFNIEEGKLRINRSDFSLTGDLDNILSYFRSDSILRGRFEFVSGTTDIAELMALTSGLGSKDSTATNLTENKPTDTTYAGPWMVPRRMDLLLNTSIKTATMGADTASNIKGSVRVRDGILVLDGLSFRTPAARMQLTAIYRTPRKNHLFLGLDYHMLDVEIGELLTMIPDIDTLMPMLRSFSGKGEFHIAVETYLDSLYNIKKSTLRGASSIKGNDLVLMDGETFSEIAKTLRFNKKTQNRVDSLSAEFTIFRNEIDVYPFLIVLDKYKAVVAGRHNFDMSFDYHISVVDSPLPIKLGVDIKGNENDLSYRLAKCRYAEFYRPTARHEVENKQLELRKLIRDALTEKVKDKD